eukprot:TRINITY_DN2140_c0_g2_i1.p3 TRINITY_DN2140_c0_g2~~TRINITY_DN2140_c0_g2_i1.p3  ORF type:complete len:144 (+),score=26.61 TRINITY_DN2140_c0_g2_i1:177-608(+)
MAHQQQQQQAAQSSITELQRFEEIEQHVLQSLEVAANVTEELSNLAGADKQVIQGYCEQFQGHMQKAQELLLEFVGKYRKGGQFQQSVYQQLGQVLVRKRKIEMVEKRLDILKQTLEGVKQDREEGEGESGVQAMDVVDLSHE